MLKLSHVSHLSWEVIVVDDNSPDGTQEIAHQLAKVYGEDKIVRSNWSFALYGKSLTVNVMTDSKAPCRQTWPWVSLLSLRRRIHSKLLLDRTAYIHGLQFVSGDFVIIMDADFSHHVGLTFYPTLAFWLIYSSLNSFLNSSGKLLAFVSDSFI